MIFRELLTNQLNEKQAEFTEFSANQGNSLQTYRQKLQRLEQFSAAEIKESIDLNNEFGAIPSPELDVHKSFTVSFKHNWKNHEDSRSWAFEILKDRTTFAVDGSQIPPTRDFSMPVAAVQIGWFENPHSETKRYEKNADFFVLSPDELMPMPHEARVSERRIQEEIERAKKFLTSKKGWRERGEKLPLGFYDNTLLVPFQLSADSKTNYVNSILELVHLSEETQVPIVGYTANSRSTDLMKLLDSFDLTLANSDLLFDSDILFPEFLQFWGDRTIFCYAHRKGLEQFGTLVGFVYLQSTSDATPARIDIPSWIYEANLLDEVLDIVRAECVIGLGYPYALETADQTAVITTFDREIFYRALQEFAKLNKLNFSVSRKAASKGRRR
ncbi:MAG: DNA double-strand break repair nuclease NurA [Pyrinomonadaceae bacterium]|nr:DNA double-strand break repair nuclease NurA [Pyrinomonadaceae bacterium]